MRSKLRSTPAPAAASSIYWDSVDSSGSGGSSGTGSRNYVDPWDLENYAYLRRHSVAAAATTTTQPIYGTHSQSVYGTSRMSRHSPVEPDYWYAPSIREPGYDAPASVEEIYFRPQRPMSTSCYYHQPIYEDETATTLSSSHYAAPAPIYSPLSELEQAEALEEMRTRDTMRRRSKVSVRSNRIYQSREECYYHHQPQQVYHHHHRRRPSAMLTPPQHVISDIDDDEEEVDGLVDDFDTTMMSCYGRVKPSGSSPARITLNTYGHLKIDYTDSWNSLHRKIVSK